MTPPRNLTVPQLPEHPGLTTVGVDAPRGERFAGQTADKAITDLFNSAQPGAFRRAQRLLATPPRPEPI